MPDRALSLIDRAVGFVSRIGDFTTFSLVILTGIFVFMRYILNSPFQGTEDVLGLTRPKGCGYEHQLLHRLVVVRSCC